jgi:hypothetical protein
MRPRIARLHRQFVTRLIGFATILAHGRGRRSTRPTTSVHCERSLPAVAEWSYGHAERVQAEMWLGGTEYGHLSAGWRGLLA